MISELELESLRKKVDRQVLELKTAETSLEKEKEKLEAAEDRILVAEEAQHVAQRRGGEAGQDHSQADENAADRGHQTRTERVLHPPGGHHDQADHQAANREGQ